MSRVSGEHIWPSEKSWNSAWPYNYSSSPALLSLTAPRDDNLFGHLGFLGSMLPQYMALCVSQSKNFLKCNISLTEAQIFMKFETYVYKIVLDHQPNFHKDPCKDACARGVNARARISLYHLEVKMLWFFHPEL